MWVLIVVILRFNSMGMSSIEMGSEQACKTAGAALVAEANKVGSVHSAYFVCAKKD